MEDPRRGIEVPRCSIEETHDVAVHRTPWRKAHRDRLDVGVSELTTSGMTAGVGGVSSQTPTEEAGSRVTSLWMSLDEAECRNLFIWKIPEKAPAG